MKSLLSLGGTNGHILSLRRDEHERIGKSKLLGRGPPMISEESDINTILVGARETINRVSDSGFKAALAKIPDQCAARLAFMTREHHLIRNLVVRELPRENSRPIRVDWLAATLGLPLPKVHAIVEELERHLFFLVRNEAGEISWAFPVTTEPTPHRLTSSTGERAYGA